LRVPDLRVLEQRLLLGSLMDLRVKVGVYVYGMSSISVRTKSA